MNRDAIDPLTIAELDADGIAELDPAVFDRLDPAAVAALDAKVYAKLYAVAFVKGPPRDAVAELHDFCRRLPQNTDPDILLRWCSGSRPGWMCSIHLGDCWGLGDQPLPDVAICQALDALAYRVEPPPDPPASRPDPAELHPCASVERIAGRPPAAGGMAAAASC